MRKRIALATIAALLVVIPLVASGCNDSDADVAARNISKAAEQFEIPRHIVGINGITDKYLFEVVGYCSLETTEGGLQGALEVTCKVGTGKDAKYKKVFLGLADNVTFVAEQLRPVQVSTTRYRVIFKPETLIPNFDRP